MAFLALRDGGAFVVERFDTAGLADLLWLAEEEEEEVVVCREVAALTALLTADFTDCGMLSLRFLVTAETVSEMACAILRFVPWFKMGSRASFSSLAFAGGRSTDLGPMTPRQVAAPQWQGCMLSEEKGLESREKGGCGRWGAGR